MISNDLTYDWTPSPTGREFPIRGLSALELSAIDAVLFHHPSARVVLLLVGVQAEVGHILDPYWKDGYCVVLFPLRIDLVMTLVYRVVSPMERYGLSDHALQELLGRVGVEPGQGLAFSVNAGLLALQLLFGGVSLSMDMLLLNAFDSWLPAPLSLTRAAVFLERTLEPGGVIASYAAPRSLPKGCDFGKQAMQLWIASYAQTGAIQALDPIVTRLFKTYVRSRVTPPTDDSCEVVLLPGWALAEPHFPDGFRYYGRRGSEDELEDRPHYHSQLYSARAHKERADWSLIRSLKMFLPLDYGPPSARNVLPRSIVDLTRRMLSLRLGPFDVGPMRFGVAEGGVSGRRWRAPVDSLDALQNSMIESFDLGKPKLLPREAALPGEVGGYRTFRDVRVVGPSSCGARTVKVTIEGPTIRFFCRRAARVEGGAGEDSDAPERGACRQALSVDKASFRLTGAPARVNAALSLLAFDPRPGRWSLPEGRLNETELKAHYANLSFSLEETCSSQVNLTMEALLDDVEEHVTVAAHSASRCDLLERLGLSFRLIYRRLPILVTCECAEEAECHQLLQRPHPSIPAMQVVDVPFDFGLSRGKKLLVSRVETEFILVLDDDFVRSPLSCLECMLWHMRSQLHSLTLPFDLLGFPILEDERNFGAFRGRLRPTKNRLFLEPIVADATADGCTRVGIHPMAFLGRTRRLQSFKFQDNLRVGEHEQFFYSNKYLGLQAAVCFDSTFPHFRVKMKGAYQKRRERMQELMTQEFSKIGFPSMMYLLQKYDTLSGLDHSEFISKDVPPWHISDDTCGPQADPPAACQQFFAAIFSSASERSAWFRRILRGEEESNVWLPKLADVAAVNWAFLLDESAAAVSSIMEEDG
ncbi:Protein xylosyltransferase [Durusdinium trenchii]|uniref:Protein xylosyltransferase n=1 Tax=Durusdinium trenchii TaxID=1381693 RepID=A0ABP0S5U3_9DINO